MTKKILSTIVIFIYYSQTIFSSWMYYAEQPDSSYSKINISTTDPLNNLIFAGYYEKEMTLFSQTFYSDIGSGFIGKVNTSGNLDWLINLLSDTSSLNALRINGITSDLEGNVFATGLFNRKANISGTIISSNSTADNGYILKLNNKGELIWVKIFTAPLNTSGAVIQWFDNKLYLGVLFKKEFEFDGKQIRNSHPYGEDSTTSAILCLSEDGSLEWSTVINSEYSYIKSIAVDNNCVYALCPTKEQPYLTYNENEIMYLDHAIKLKDDYLICLNKDGSGRWSNQIGSSETVFGTSVKCYNDAIYCCGSFKKELKAKSQDGNMQSINGSSKSFQGYLAKYDKAGNAKWLKKVGINCMAGFKKIEVDKDHISASIFFKDSITIGTNKYFTKENTTESLILIMDSENGEDIKSFNASTQHNSNSNSYTYLNSISPISKVQFLLCGYTTGRQIFGEFLTTENPSPNMKAFVGFLDVNLSTKFPLSPTYELYPNPSSGIINFTYLPKKPSSIEVFNMQGQLILSKRISSTRVDLSTLTKGCYILISNGNRYKLLIE